jgi:phosphoglycerate dehydrogenase-like enzyme
LSEKPLTLFLTDRGQRHQLAALKAAPPELEVIVRRRPPREELPALLPEVEFLVSERSGAIDADMIQAAGRLRLIQRLGSLVHDIDLQAARAAGVPVCAVPVRGARLVAEHMLMQILALAKRLPEASQAILSAGGDVERRGESRRTDEDTFAYNWSGLRGIVDLWDRTFGIWGFGEIGVDLARRLRGFVPARVLYHKRNRLPALVEADLDLAFADVDSLVAESDFLCLLLPYAPETDRLVDAAVLGRMKPGAFLVSAGSGSVIDEAALADALRAGRLAGAALDTFEWEPILPDNPLLPLAREARYNVLLTPHTGGGSVEDPPGLARARDYENLLRVLRGEPPRHRVA